MKPFGAALLMLMVAGTGLSAMEIVERDVCVYGGTSGGVAAAVAAARLGKRVALLSLNDHVGGMTASGLGVTDIGPGNNTLYVGGISREFYQRVGAAYGSANLVIWFEPHVAEGVFRQMLTGAGVDVFSNRRLAVAVLNGNRIVEIRMEDGSVFRAGQFIDTTYEGDLMAAAGVTHTWGREATGVYGESLAGIRPLSGAYSYDPYVVPGNPASGLLPFVNPGTAGAAGEGDRRLQAYNFRLCLTQNPTNRIPIEPPPGYSEADYELVRRYVAARVARDGAVSLGQLIHIQQIIPNGKTDINANGELSTDYVGYSHTWATNTHAGREQLRLEHEHYIRGLLHFYATSTNIPSNLNAEMQSWGLAADEFADNGGWPWQIYVREARRMIGDYVMTQSNCEGRVIAPDGICLARYPIDSHGVQRLAAGGLTRWEGGIGGTPPYPYPVSYRSIVPRAGEVENLLCTFALSASHVGFASCRMEPVFMMSSHAAGAAAAFALDDAVTVQQLDYAKLAAQLHADGQRLEWTTPGSGTNGILLDQGLGGTANSGGWSSGANAGGWNGDYWHDGASGKGGKWVRYTPTLPTNGTYEVYAWWVEHSNRPTNTPYDITHTAGTTRVLVNQRLASGGWFRLLTTNFNAGTSGSVTIRNDNTAPGTYCIADGVRFLGLGAAAPPVSPPTVDVVASDPVAGVFGPDPGRVAVVRRGPTDQAVTVHYRVGGTAVGGVDYVLLPGTLTLPAGTVSSNLVITPLGVDLDGDTATVVVELLPSADYDLSSLSHATVVLHDRPLNRWLRAHFSPLELADPATSGDAADWDQDGLPTLMEHALGLSPKTADANPFLPRVTGDYFELTVRESMSAVDVETRVEWSPDLVDWFDGPGSVAETGAVEQGAGRLKTWRAMPPLSAQRSGFVRVSVHRK